MKEAVKDRINFYMSDKPIHKMPDYEKNVIQNDVG
jgi:hypothetical protein